MTADKPTPAEIRETVDDMERVSYPVGCWKCHEPAAWLVEDDSGEGIYTCDKHRTEAFS